MGSKKLIAKLTTKLGRRQRDNRQLKQKEKKKAKRKAADDTPPPSKKAKTNGKTGKTDTAAWRKSHDVKSGARQAPSRRTAPGR